MYPGKVEQNRELLYKFHLRDDKHGGMNFAGVPFLPIQQWNNVLNVITA
jgi:hypothetical protein